MNKACLTVLAACLILAAATMSPARGDAAPQGSTMRIEQEILLGDLSATADYRAYFLPPDKFRVEGVMRPKKLEMDVEMTVVSTGAMVKELCKMPFGQLALTVDLDRIRKTLSDADYSPSKTFDPRLYNEMVKSAPDKKSLPAEKLDGAETEGYELPLPESTLSLPFNAPAVLPKPAKARIWINPKDGIARKVELEDAQGRTFLRTRYTEVKTGVRIKPEMFDLEFPKGVEPTDITDRVLKHVTDARRPPERTEENRP